MSTNSSYDFPIAKDAYVAFDGLSIKEKIRQRLNQTGVFTDQNFEGSNLNAINDAFGMIFSVLLFNLNKAVNEGRMDAQIYENVNRYVKQLDYKPIGHQTASLSFTLSVKNLLAGIYTIPRYSSIKLGGISYSFKDDISFVKSVDNTLEELTSVGDNNLLYQGTFIEYPLFNPAGTENEIIYLTTSDNISVDNFAIDVYVYRNNKWVKWNRTSSLYLHDSTEYVYECRFNENKRYELKFGNNINGSKLLSTDIVAIYYLKSDGTKGEVGANVLNGKKLSVYDSAQFASILADNSFISTTDATNLIFTNACASTYYTEPESIASIKQNAPANFRNQYSLTTAKSYETFIKSNFSSIIQDVVVKNNSDYLDGYIKYFYSIGLTQPHLESRALFNHLHFADSCNFNNVYIFVVPKSVANNLSYLTPAQKSVILSSMEEEKTLTAELVILDPVYIALDIALGMNGQTASLDDVSNTFIYIQKSSTTRRNDASIISDVNNLLTTYFSKSSNTLGQTVDLLNLQNKILGIDGIKKIYTYNSVDNSKVEGLRFVSWNPIVSGNTFENLVGTKTMEYFQFPYLFTSDFSNRIVIENGTNAAESIGS